MLYGTASTGGTGGYGTVFKISPVGAGFTNLYNFQNDVDGANPDAGLVLSGGRLFGTATAGGTGGNGTVFALGTNGAGFSVLWNFSAGATNAAGVLTNADGLDPEAGLTLSAGRLYGTTYGGGAGGNGVVFTLNTNGSGNGFTVLKTFTAGKSNADGVLTNADGAGLEAGLVLAGTNLFGAAYLGGANGSGTLFSLGTNGGGFTVLKTFPAINPITEENTDGANPYGGLLLAGGTLYGTAENGGSAGDGTVFAASTNGSGFTVLKTFSATDPDTATNTDGANPDGGMVLSGTNLLGTTSAGGFWANGTVFMVSTNSAQGGKWFANLHSFTNWSDGANPAAALWLSGGAVFGTASGGGNWNAGTIFSLSTNGTSYTNLYVFDGSDGVAPLGGLVLSGTNYYGLTSAGGSANNGMIFKVNTNGTAFTVLKNFSATDPNTGTNNDGANPQGNLVLASGLLFGTATAGGTGGSGTVFRLGTNGAGFSVLWNFSAGVSNAFAVATNADGIDPEAGLSLSGGLLFGTTYSGGLWGNGTVFMVPTNSNGRSLTVLKTFSVGHTDAAGNWTNADGASPEAGLLLAGTNLFGTTYLGGANGNGTLFKLGTNGGGFTVLKTFSLTDPVTGTNNDGANPYADLILSGVTLFGTAENGGTAGNGTVFALGTNGLGFTVLKSLPAADPVTGTNTDGANPDGGLVLSSNLLFGTTSAGGYLGGGTIFEITTNGGGFANLHNFAFDTEGDSPFADLILSGNVLSATTSEGGVWGGGTVFDLNLTVTSPLLTITGSGATLNVTWPWPAVGFVLEQNTNLASTNWWSFPGTINDNGILRSAPITSGSGNLFFRLSHP